MTNRKFDANRDISTDPGYRRATRGNTRERMSNYDESTPSSKWER